MKRERKKNFLKKRERGKKSEREGERKKKGGRELIIECSAVGLIETLHRQRTLRI